MCGDEHPGVCGDELAHILVAALRASSFAYACFSSYLACASQDVVLPKEHCDDRVEIMQADARTLNIHELYTKFEVVLQHVQKKYKQEGSGHACIETGSSVASTMA